MNDNPSASNKASETELPRMIAEYGARLVSVCTLLLGDRDLAQDEQNPPLKLKNWNAKMKKLSY